LVRLEDEPGQTGPNHGDAGSLASTDTPKTEGESGTANSVEFSSTRETGDGGLPPGKLPS